MFQEKFWSLATAISFLDDSSQPTIHTNTHSLRYKHSFRLLAAHVTMLERNYALMRYTHLRCYLCALDFC